MNKFKYLNKTKSSLISKRGERRKSMVKKEKIINNKKTLKSETVLTDGKNYSSIKIPPNSIELRVEKIKS